MKTCEDGVCLVTGHEIKINGPQDEQRMSDCPLKPASDLIELFTFNTYSRTEIEEVINGFFEEDKE